MNITDVSSQITQGMIISSPKLTLMFLGCGFLLFLVIIGVLANITVCSVLMRNRRFKKHISNFMLFHLSITDMVYRLIVVPAQLIALVLPIQNKPVLLCKLSKTLSHTVHTAVFTSLVVIALDRQQSIMRPFKRLGHNPKFYLYVLAIWSYSIVIATPQIYIEEVRNLLNVTVPNVEGMNVTYHWQVCSSSKGSTQGLLTIVYFILGFLVPLLIITVAYSKVAIYLWRKSRNPAVNQAALRSKGKSLQMLVFMVFGFVVCLGLPQVKDVMDSFGFDVKIFTLCAFVLQLSSSVVNPIINGYYSAEFKQGLRN